VTKPDGNTEVLNAGEQVKSYVLAVGQTIKYRSSNGDQVTLKNVSASQVDVTMQQGTGSAEEPGPTLDTPTEE
jgi:hypothetical protein